MTSVIVVLTLDDGRTERVEVAENHMSFSNRNDIVSAVIPEGIKTIGWSAFEGCSSLVSVTLPVGLEAILSSAFAGCRSLVALAIPDTVYVINTEAFANCSSLTSVTLPKSLFVIETNTFYNCDSLISATIPVGVRRLQKAAFNNCSSLVRVNIMDPTARMEKNTFRNCPSINSVNIHDTVTILFFDGYPGEKKIREMHKGQPAWKHVFPSCPAANIKWRTSVREGYEAGFVDRTTAMTMLMSMRRKRDDPDFTGSFPAEMMEKVLEYAN